MSAGISDDIDFDSLKPLTLLDALSTTWGEPDYVLGPLQPGDVGLIAGADGAGKSWLCDVAGLTVAAGVSVSGIFEKPKYSGAVIHFSGEDRREDHGRRLRSLLESETFRSGLKQEDIEAANGRYVKYPLLGVRMPLVRRTSDGGCEITKTGRTWSERIANFRLVLVDPARMVHNLEEGDGFGMDFFVRWLVSVAMKNKQAIVLVHHASQSAILSARDDHHAGRGATDLPAGCRAVWILRAANGSDGIDPSAASEWRVLKNSKASHRREADRVMLRREESGVLVAATSHVPKKSDSCPKIDWRESLRGQRSDEF